VGGGHPGVEEQDADEQQSHLPSVRLSSHEASVPAD
jgi:hypothetical protein